MKIIKLIPLHMAIYQQYAELDSDIEHRKEIKQNIDKMEDFLSKIVNCCGETGIDCFHSKQFITDDSMYKLMLLIKRDDFIKLAEYLLGMVGGTTYNNIIRENKAGRLFNLIDLDLIDFWEEQGYETFYDFVNSKYL